MSAEESDGWYENEHGTIKHDSTINNQKDLDDKNIKGEFIAKSFLGENQNGQVFEFQSNGDVNFKDGATSSAYKAGGFDGDFVSVISSGIGKKSDGNISTASTLVLSPQTAHPAVKLVAGIVAIGYLMTAAIQTGSSEDMQFSFSLPESIKTSGFFDSMGQRGNNDKRLGSEELERISTKPIGERTSAEKQKLKAHEKATQQRGSRHSKGGKKR
ncbi:hypothetical protein [Flavobacterium sp. JP2137]|uniref:hypothetical protein n=1 Tax=Flavobacterium sp. JP2137 TaxID=3414510 RepID=UPI003D2FC629